MNTKQKFMKKFKSYIPLASAALLLGCSSDDKLVDKVQDSVQRGAVLRTISFSPNAFFFDNTASEIAFTWEYQDIEDGGLLSSVDVSVGFVDGTPANGTTTASTAPLANLTPADFSVGPNGLPRTDFSISYGEALDALGLEFDPDVVTGSDQIIINTTLNLTDGRVITASDLSGTVAGGTFFQTPLTYRANIVCPPRAGEPGTWTIDMQDSYGDGWNGASLTVTIDDEATDYTIDNGGAASATFDVPAGAESLSIVYNSGDWDSEVTFQITAPNGNVLVDTGPSPSVGTELIDYCADF